MLQRCAKQGIPGVVALAIAVAAIGCGGTKDELVLPWCKYRLVTSAGGSGMFAGSSHNEVLVRRWWGWSRVFNGNDAPGRPMVLTPTTILVPMSGTARILRQSESEAPFACGDREAAVSVPPAGRVVDCVDHLAGPARAIATSLRVRRIDASGQPVAQQEFNTGETGRVFLKPAVSFYDDEGTAYLVTFRDPWAETLPDGSRESVQATPERLQQISCELIAVGQGATAPVVAPPGHTVADCSSAVVWSRALGRGLRSPW
jgi:hypothetical protein